MSEVTQVGGTLGAAGLLFCSVSRDRVWIAEAPVPDLYGLRGARSSKENNRFVRCAVAGASAPVGMTRGWSDKIRSKAADKSIPPRWVLLAQRLMYSDVSA
jgi:hypothetical protein